MIDVKIDSHVSEIQELTQETIDKILWMMGAKAEGFAKDETPVDTGRLRNSITFVTKAEEGKVVNYTDDKGNEYNYTVGAGLEENSVAIGTNVEYAKDVEIGTGGRAGKHMLEKAVSQHDDVYRKIIELALQEVDA